MLPGCLRRTGRDGSDWVSYEFSTQTSTPKSGSPWSDRLTLHAGLRTAPRTATSRGDYGRDPMHPVEQSCAPRVSAKTPVFASSPFRSPTSGCSKHGCDRGLEDRRPPRFGGALSFGSLRAGADRVSAVAARAYRNGRWFARSLRGCVVVRKRLRPSIHYGEDADSQGEHGLGR